MVEAKHFNIKIMKKQIKIFLVALGFFVLPFVLLAQNPRPPNGGSVATGGHTPVGGGAPIGGGLIVMLVLGSAYGLKKTKVLSFQK